MATLSNGEIFRKAADYIREHGFSLLPGPPGWRWELGGPVCAEGALLAICGISSEGAASAPLPCAPAHPTIHIAAVRAGETVRVFGREEPRLWKWSDKPGRTAEEVISLFEGLAADEELKEQVAAFDEDLKAAATAPVDNARAQLPKALLCASNGNTPETGALVSQPQLVEA